ncbi:dTDP-4-dehydrorhamnose 3,5-epimerase family protein [Parasediminibacterium paludis]|uniref:dTDP-4-dehydrorhamnose 3,5-epimerase n=1 Tax=Parasediminibacterium paludis TaxID=908966 RepID=A0ABV8Q216_9BACT
MQFEETFIEGLYIIHLNKLSDNRGSFTKMLNEDFFKANRLRTDIKESYFSISHKNVIRGMHFQTPPAEHTKLVFVNTGSIQDVVVDLRKASNTFGQYFSISVSANEPKLIYLPEGFAHGFLSLEDNTIVSYMQTSVYNKSCDEGILWNSFGFDWFNVENPIISSRDLLFKPFSEFNSPF